MILDETRERFIKAIAKQVDPARIAEIHFFAPIRQGGVESGVAVIAAAERLPELEPSVDEPVEASPEGTEAEVEATATQAAEVTSVDESVVDASATSDVAPVDELEAVEDNVEEAAPAAEEAGVEASAADEQQPDESQEAAAVADEASAPEIDAEDESPYSDVAAGAAAETPIAAEGAEVGDVADNVETPVEEMIAEPAPAAPPAPIERHVIYTARYRLTLKGPDRGKWETHVTAEADAPIITVDAVVRGVQRRAGDVDDPTRMSGEEIRAAVPATV